MALIRSPAPSCCGAGGDVAAPLPPASACRHAVEFYEDDHALADTVAQFLIGGFLAGDAAIIVVISEHREAIELALRERDVQVEAVQRTGALRVLDAADCLDALTVDGRFDANRFAVTVGALVREMKRSHGRVRLCGEAAALLWERGARQDAAALEAASHAFCAAERCEVLCAYPAGVLVAGEDCVGRIFDAHSHATLPASDLGDPALARSATPAGGRVAVRKRIEQWCAADVPFALILLDLDDFHVINNDFGSDFGDEVLAAVRRVLSDAVRKGDCVVRCVGDRFGVILGGVTDRGAALIALRKLKSALADPLCVRGQDVYVTVSAGVALRAVGSGQQDLLAAATTALHAAKAGRSQDDVVCGMQKADGPRQGRHLPTLLCKALERGEFEVHYQPKFRVGDGMLTGAEALLRWRSSELGWVAPTHFIPAAERSGLIAPIGAWVLQTACAQLAGWRDRGLDAFSVAVNLSACQLSAADLPATIRQVLDRTGLDASALELELTETALMDRVSSNIAKLSAIRALGVSLSVDDFGTGYSSLSYLTKLPVQVLKIDKSFIAQMTRDHDARTLVGAITGLARSLGLTTVAEGVETDTQFALLRRMRCDEVQGFLFGRPVPAADFERLYIRHERAAASA